MRTLLINFGFLLLIGLLYWLDIFSLFAMCGALWIVFGVIAGIFIIAFKVVGSPFANHQDSESGGQDDEHK